MRHRVDHRKLGRTAAHRKAMLCNMVTSLFAAERITTTDAKAKEARRLAERLITRAKKGYTVHREMLSQKESGNADEARKLESVALAHWRQAGRYVRKMTVLRKLFDEIAPHYLEREGGYTRIIRLNNRLGDNAQAVMLELVDTKVTLKPKTRGKDEVEEEQSGKKKAAAGKKGRGQSDKSEGDAPAKKTKTKTKTKAASKAGSKSKASTKTKSRAKKSTKGDSK
jgi:large subunit ribosomal protein L17